MQKNHQIGNDVVVVVRTAKIDVQCAHCNKITPLIFKETFLGTPRTFTK